VRTAAVKAETDGERRILVCGIERVAESDKCCIDNIKLRLTRSTEAVKTESLYTLSNTDYFSDNYYDLRSPLSGFT
jgi:hypothetical protein